MSTPQQIANAGDMEIFPYLECRMHSDILAIDVGSTRLKLAFFSDERDLGEVFSADSPLQADVVHAPDVLEAVVALIDRSGRSSVPSAIAITGATRTHVLTDAVGNALDAVVKLDDGRGIQFEARIKQAYGDQGSLGAGAFQPLARALDWQARRPDLYAEARWQLELKDWLNLQLTGVAATDPVSLARMQPPGGDLGIVATRLGLRPALFADSVPAATVIGAVQPQADQRLAHWAGVPVVQCGFDAWCASFGMGCVADGMVYNVSGTTEVFGSFGRFRKDLKEVPGVSSLQWTPELFHLGGPCQTGLGTLAWFGRTFLNNSNPQAVLDCAARAGDDCPLCLPFVSGERMPFWKPELAAQFLEVRGHHGLPEFAQALLDGLMVFQRYLMSLLAPSASDLRLSGGAATLAGWAQRKADAFALPVTTSTVTEPGLLGAAMSALTALKIYPDMAQAQTALSTSGIVANVATPDPDATRRLVEIEKRLLPQLLKLAA